ncbi:MAG TPA: DUF4349 domain-containing protein [Solirubrobacteraceae bacterium]|jgi:hypothetical protein|nr:DUF4349 domain-containing protein [Solirubrobacteraceae bacterium]
MRPFDEIPFEESDYSDVALLVASVREWPADDFAHGLDARVARRFGPEARSGGRVPRTRLPRWAAGPAVALVAGVVAAVVVLSGGGGNRATFNGPVGFTSTTSSGSGLVTHALHNGRTPAPSEMEPTVEPSSTSTTSAASGAAGIGSAGTPTEYSGHSAISGAAALSTTAVAPGAKQIRSAQLDLTTQNARVNQVAQEIFGVVGAVHGTVLSSHITTATRGSGGGYASFSLSVPTGSLQNAMTELSRLHYVAVVSSDNSSQNVSHQYNSDQRQLSDAKALRSSLLKQLAAATTDQQVDSIKAQLKLAEQQINSWQSTLGSLQHRISYSNLSVQVNQNGLPVVPVKKQHSTSGFTIGHAGHDALRVLVVSAGVALITLAVLIPVGLVAALLMWLWVWLRQRRREQALDVAS